LTDGREVISTQVRAGESSPSVQCLVLKCFRVARIAVRSLFWFCLVILRTLVSRCKHLTLTKHSMLMKSIARLASDALQRVIIDHFRQQVRNNVFRLGQKNGWAKICCPKNGFHVFALKCFCPNMIAADSRDISNRDDRTNYVSRLGCSVCRRSGFQI
jgi:hypothetical protein